MRFKTEHQLETERRNAALRDEWSRLTASPDNARTMVRSHLMKKFGIASPATFYKIINL